MQFISSIATYFGIGRDGSTEGRRRLVSMLTFISFALVISACASKNWVAGSIDFPVDGAEVSSTAHFRIDLSNVIIEFNAANDGYSPQGYTAFITYSRSVWMARQIVAATTPGCVLGQPDIVSNEENWFCGLPITDFNTDIDAVYGLFIFSSLLITIAWLMTSVLSTGAASTLFSSRASFQALAGLLGSSAFFSFVGIFAFAGAKISSTFCSVFEGPVNQQNDTVLNYCGYHDGFGIAIAAAIFTTITFLVVWYLLPWTPPTPPSSAAAAASTGNDAGKASSVGGYSNIGSTEEYKPAAAAASTTSFNAETYNAV